MFLNEDGTLNISDLITNNESFKTIMEDGIITKNEVDGQFTKVISLLRNMEAKYDASIMEDVRELMAESCIMYAVHNYYTMQNIDEE